MTNLDSIFKSRDITLPTKVCLVKATVFPVVIYGCESWTIKKANALANWCKKLTNWKRPWCWERLKAWGEGDDRGWDGYMALPTWWAWVWASSGSWWWTGKPGVLQSMGWQRVRHDRATKLNCTALLMTLFDPSLIIVTVTFLHVKLGFPFGKC